LPIRSGARRHERRKRARGIPARLRYVETKLAVLRARLKAAARRLVMFEPRTSKPTAQPRVLQAIRERERRDSNPRFTPVIRVRAGPPRKLA